MCYRSTLWVLLERQVVELIAVAIMTAQKTYSSHQIDPFEELKQLPLVLTQ